MLLMMLVAHLRDIDGAIFFSYLINRYFYFILNYILFAVCVYVYVRGCCDKHERGHKTRT